MGSQLLTKRGLILENGPFGVSDLGLPKCMFLGYDKTSTVVCSVVRNHFPWHAKFLVLFAKAGREELPDKLINVHFCFCTQNKINSLICIHKDINNAVVNQRQNYTKFYSGFDQRYTSTWFTQLTADVALLEHHVVA